MRRRPAAVRVDFDERAGARHVRVPQIVMHGLEVPLVFAGLRIHRDDRIAIEVVPRPIAAVVVGRRPRDRQVRDAALVVDRRGKAPHVRPLAVLPAVRPHVSLYFSPAFGTVWNSHSFLPVTTSNARGLPMAFPSCGFSVDEAPTMATFL